MMILERKKFEKLVNEGIKAIPEKFLKKLDNVDIIIEDTPTPDQLRKLRAQKGLIIFGLYEGVPQTKRWHYSQVLPDKITIFKKPIEKFAHSAERSEGSRRTNVLRAEEEVKEIVKNTVWHEIAHHFGMDERRVKEVEFQRRFKKN